MNIRTRIIISLLPVLLPIVMMDILEYRSEREQLDNSLSHMVSYAASVGTRELNEVFRASYDQFHHTAANLSQCLVDSESPSNDVMESVLKNTSKFSALILSDTQGHERRTLLSISPATRHMLRRNIEGQLLSVEVVERLKADYQHWLDNKDQRLKRFALLSNELESLRKQGELMSRRFRLLSHQLSHLSEHQDHLPIVISFGGEAMIRTLGLPFANNSLLFSIPVQNCNGKMVGIITLILDWTQVEDVLFRLRQQLNLQDLERVDVALFYRHAAITPVRYLDRTKILVAEPQKSDPDDGYMGIANVVDVAVLNAHESRVGFAEINMLTKELKNLARKFSFTKLLVYVDPLEREYRLKEIGWRMAGWSMLSMAILLLMTLGIAHSITNGLKKLEQRMNYAAHNSSEVAFLQQVYRADEIGQLERVFHFMLKKLAEKEQQLQTLASTDNLTRLMNRHAFTVAADRAQALAKRNGSDIYLLLFDLDYFKNINDRFGHSTGDLALCHFTQILKQNLRSVDSPSRIGGEEFLCLLSGPTRQDAQGIAERIRKQLQNSPLVLDDGTSVSFTVSGGLCAWPVNLSYDQVFVQVDKLLYEAKKQGRNCIVIEPN
ncbi:GGDEF domain-containing protein [Photobacterium alginatilyticum]|uniref:diguanylate cyclase n=1 Tax=Photobacterium alginatilyticum TaxID=1775171 RepID=A0ABW9YEL1_9GAMM|nr:GGDEF domain-containing protein [Photobacterium alginatilyticum]NBI52230.1 GGDEF domain-containing protein [Photobacterium alginatilyticum]